MKTLHSILLLLSLMLIPSCRNEENYSNLIKLKFDYNQLVDDFDYTELTDSFIEIIPLETKAECLISKISKIEITDQYIFVKDDLAKSVFMFDKNGHFIDKINAVGQGPGEYVSLSYLTVTDSSVLIIDHLLGKQFEYLYPSMKFIKGTNLFDKIWCTDDFFVLNNYVYYLNSSDSRAGKYALFSYKDGVYNKFIKFKDPPFGLSAAGPNYSLNGKDAHFFFDKKEIIYKISNDTVEAEYYVDYQHPKVEYKDDNPTSVFDNPAGRIIGINAINESDRFLLVNISVSTDNSLPNNANNNRGEYICLFDKYERTTIIIPRFNTKMGRFDDFYFSIDRVIDNKLICFMDVNNLLLVNQYDYQDKQFSNKAFEKKIKCVINSLKEDDNPVLFIFKFKD